MPTNKTGDGEISVTVELGESIYLFVEVIDLIHKLGTMVESSRSDEAEKLIYEISERLGNISFDV